MNPDQKRPRPDEEIAAQFSGSVDDRNGLVGREIFSNEELYRLELKRIFARCWLYLAHESQIPKPGDFVTVNMGTEPVIVVRSHDGTVRAFVNSCRHRGNKVCRLDSGNTRAFVCAYHGWSYDTRGRLLAVPGAKEYYGEKPATEEWGLPKVAQVASYGGLIFGTLDPDAPSLDTFLGDMRWGLDLLLAQGDLIAVPGIVRWQMDCDWKFAADNAVGDMYHGAFTHQSAIRVGHRGGNGVTRLDQSRRNAEGITLVSKYGHGLNADFVAEGDIVDDGPLAAWRRDPAVQTRLGPVGSKVNRANINIFPNLFINTGSRDLMLRNPLGPNRIEIWKTILVDRKAPADVQREQVRASNRHFGPAGMFEQDDGENWVLSTQGATGTVSQAYPLHYAMGLGKGHFVSDGQSPTRIDSLVNENAQMWLYRSWADFIRAESWSELAAAHELPEDAL